MARVTLVHGLSSSTAVMAVMGQSEGSGGPLLFEAATTPLGGDCLTSGMTVTALSVDDVLERRCDNHEFESFAYSSHVWFQLLELRSSLSCPRMHKDFCSGHNVRFEGLVAAL